MLGQPWAAPGDLNAGAALPSHEKKAYSGSSRPGLAATQTHNARPRHEGQVRMLLSGIVCCTPLQRTRSPLALTHQGFLLPKPAAQLPQNVIHTHALVGASTAWRRRGGQACRDRLHHIRARDLLWRGGGGGGGGGRGRPGGGAGRGGGARRACVPAQNPPRRGLRVGGGGGRRVCVLKGLPLLGAGVAARGVAIALIASRQATCAQGGCIRPGVARSCDRQHWRRAGSQADRQAGREGTRIRTPCPPRAPLPAPPRPTCGVSVRVAAGEKMCTVSGFFNSGPSFRSDVAKHSGCEDMGEVEGMGEGEGGVGKRAMAAGQVGTLQRRRQGGQGGLPVATTHPRRPPLFLRHK